MHILPKRTREIRNKGKNIRGKMRRATSSRRKKVIRIGSSKRYLGRDGVCSGSASQKSAPSSTNRGNRLNWISTPLTLVNQRTVHHHARKSKIYARSSTERSRED